jgi:hypothetical protein
VIHGGDVYRNKVVLDYSVNLNPMPLPEAVETAAREGRRADQRRESRGSTHGGEN